jgi:hypothetical protein
MNLESDQSTAPVAQSLIGVGDEQQGRKLFITGSSGLAVALAYFAFTAKVADPVHLYLGLFILTLSILPGLLWARSGGNRFPVFEVVMLLCANTYAWPLLASHDQVVAYHPDVITKAAVSVLLYQLAALGAYQLTPARAAFSQFWRESLISVKVERWMLYGLTFSTGYIWTSTFTEWIPADISSIFRAVFFGVGVICTFVGMQRWGRGELRTCEKFYFFINLVIQVFLMSLGLVLISAISMIGIALLGYIASSKRLPWGVLLLTFVVIGLLHSGKSRMREKYWNPDEYIPGPTTLGLPAFYAEWFGYGVEKQHDSQTSTSRKLLERTSLMHILCLIVTYTPERQDYLYGKSYSHVLPQLIPRFFWPEKPRSHIATYELAIYYGLQDEASTQTTTIAFGMLTEAYANFGLFGTMMLGLTWGVVFKKLRGWTTHSPLFSFGGLMMVLLTAWSLNSEMTMAVWLSSFQQAVVVVLGVPLLLRRLFGL